MDMICEVRAVAPADCERLLNKSSSPLDDLRLALEQSRRAAGSVVISPHRAIMLDLDHAPPRLGGDL
jgi:hypothetical protein